MNASTITTLAPDPDSTAGFGTVAAVIPDQTPINQLFAFDSDRLVISDMSDPVLKSLHRSGLSFSTANSVLGCPTRFVIDAVTPQIEAPFAQNSLGTSAHKVLELLFQLPAAERTPAAANVILNNLVTTHPKEITFPEDPSQRTKWRGEVATRIAGLWRFEDPTTVTVISTEMAFAGARVAGIPAHGFIDRVDLLDGDNGDGMRVKVVDFKAGNVKTPYKGKDSHGDQLRTYALAYADVRGVMPTEASIYYIRHGVATPVDLSAAALGKTEQQLIKAWDIIQTSAEAASYALAPSPLCSWCPLATVCPAAIGAGRNVKGKNQDPAEFADIVGVGERLLIPLARHSPARITHQSTPEASMTDDDATPVVPRSLSFGVLTEDKVWEELSRGALNPVSYAAVAAFSLVELAIETLEAADVRVTPKTVRALSATFAAIIEPVQREMTRGVSLQEGAHNRLRDALRTTISSFGAPFGGTADQWGAWQNRMTKRIVAIVNTSYWLWERSATGFGTEPWANLVGIAPETPPPAEDKTAAVQRVTVSDARPGSDGAALFGAGAVVVSPVEPAVGAAPAVAKAAPKRTIPEPVAAPEPAPVAPKPEPKPVAIAEPLMDAIPRPEPATAAPAPEPVLVTSGASAVDYDPASDFDDF